MSVATFKVKGALDKCGGEIEGTVRIDRDLGLFEVRPKGRRRSYVLPLDEVATKVCQTVLLSEARENGGTKRKIKIRRGALARG